MVEKEQSVECLVFARKEDQFLKGLKKVLKSCKQELKIQ